VGVKTNAALRFSKTYATLQFEFLYPKGERGCIHWPMISM
jgi:hypothetical protein